MSALLQAGDGTFLPRLVSVFFAVFHPQHGPVVLYDVPEGSVAKAPPEPPPQKQQEASRRPRSPRSQAPPAHPGDLRHAQGYFALGDIDRVSSVADTSQAHLYGSPTTPRPPTHPPEPDDLLSPPLPTPRAGDCDLAPDSLAGLSPPSLIDRTAEASVITIRNSAGQSNMTIRPTQPNFSCSKERGIDARGCQRTSLSSGLAEDEHSEAPAMIPAVRLFDFDTISHLLIPPPTLCGRLLICSAPALSTFNADAEGDDDERGRGRRRTRSGAGESLPSRASTGSSTRAYASTEYKIVSHPMALSHEKYERMNLVYNLCFVFEAGASTTAYEGVVRKCARALRDLELTAGFLSQPHNLRRMHNVCEQLYEDLNSYCESFVALPHQPHTNFMLEGASTPRLAVNPTPEVADRAIHRGHPSPKQERRKFSSPDWADANVAEDELETKVLLDLGDSEEGKQLQEELDALSKAASAAVAGEEWVVDNRPLPQVDRKGRPLPVDTQELLPKRQEPPHGLGRTVQEAINVKLFPTYPNPPEAQDWDVPVALLNLAERVTGDWDLTMSKIIPFIDGIRHVRRIAQLADVDLDLTKQCMEHLLYYGCIVMNDIFQHSNIYTVRPLLAREGDQEDLFAECGQYVTRLSYPVVGHAKLLQLFAAFTPTKTVAQWCDEQNIDALGIDPRRFVSFGTLKGLLRRMHRIPVIASSAFPLDLGFEPRTSPSTSRTRSGARGRNTVQNPDTDMPSPEQAHFVPAALVSPQARPWWGAVSNGLTGARSLDRGRTRRGHKKRDLQLIREESWAPGSVRSRGSHGSGEDPPVHSPRVHRRRPLATATDPASLAFQSAAEAQALEESAQQPSMPESSLPPHPGQGQHIPVAQRVRVIAPGCDSGSGPGSRPSLPSTATLTPGMFAPQSSPPGRKGKSASSFGLGPGLGGQQARTGCDHRLASLSAAHGALRAAGWPARPRPPPSELITFCDGTHTDDAICTHFAVPWSDVQAWIDTVNADAVRTPAPAHQRDYSPADPEPLMSAFVLPPQAGASTPSEHANAQHRQAHTFTDSSAGCEPTWAANDTSAPPEHQDRDAAGPPLAGAAIKIVIM